jgi:glycosyltransferase involved in cell wall biosynthesis
MAAKSLSVFFPMYNESKNISTLLEEACRVIPQMGFDDYEILIVDDGSQDGCAQIVEQWSVSNPHIRMIRHPQNLGYGAALRTGFTHASRDLVFYTDCDLPVDLREVQRALPLLEHDDLVIGYRIKRYETLRRAIYSRIYNFLMRILFNVHVRDVNFSFKIMHKRVLDHICLSASSVFIDGQLLAEAVRYGFSIAEIPIRYTPRRFGRSNFDSLKAATSTLKELLAYRYDRFFGNSQIAQADREVNLSS